VVAVNSRLTTWAPLPPAVYLRRPRRSLPFPLEEAECRLVAWARHGIWHGVRQLGLGCDDAVLVPSYNHGSEVEALLRAKVRCVFYELDADLAPLESDLERLRDGRTRALYLTHFLGFPQDSSAWRAWCDARGLMLIEDAAQAWLATQGGLPVGALADLAVFCLYKTFGLPEGAVVYQRSPMADVGLDRRLGLSELARRNGRWLAARYGVVAAARERVRRIPPPVSNGEDFDLRDPHTGPWAHTPFVLRRVADPQAAIRRRENFAFLLERLRQLVPRPFDALAPGASPFAFPIDVDDKPAVLRRLAAAGIVALDLWGMPHPALPEELFADAARRRSRTLALPVHQELRASDLRRIARVTADALR
jgi:DegT/DnrJ/EryC1/StrS aminotransferase family